MIVGSIALIAAKNMALDLRFQVKNKTHFEIMPLISFLGIKRMIQTTTLGDNGKTFLMAR